MVANDDPKLAAEELERAKKLGFAGVMIPTVAGEGVPQYHERGMDVLWEPSVANEMSINIHAGTTRDRNKKANLITASGARKIVVEGQRGTVVVDLCVRWHI